MRARTRVRKRAIITVVAAGMAATTFFAGPVQADPHDQPGSVGQAGPTGRSGEGEWSVTAVKGGGYRITLRLDEPLPVRDAVAELAVDGRSLGPAKESPDGRTLTVDTADPRVASASSVRVAWNGVIPSAGAGRQASPGRVPAPSATGRSLPVDPATPGAYTVERAEYDLGDAAISLSGLGARPAEIRAAVYLPKEARGARRLVLFLHGRHAACYDPVAWTSSNSQWPCPDGQQPIASYQGYDGAAEALASHGYAVVSISANGVNAADNPYSEDRGALARGELVMKHLDLLAAAAEGRGDPQLVQLFKGRIDLSNVGLMGHSRGGEGVVKVALLNADRRSPYGIRAVLPLAPTDFARATLPNLPMAVLLPYCDGDVSNQQGQHFYDDTRYADPADPAFRGSLMVMGTNHNFFNTEWTPGIARFPASDDWRDNTDPVCGNTAPSRLGAEEQYAVGTAYIAGFFRLVQGGEKALLPLFDGTGGTVPSAGRVVVHTVAQAPAGQRLDVAPFTSLPSSVRVSGAATGVICASMLDRSPQSGLPSCASTLTTAQAPSWTPATYAPNVVATPVLRFAWTGTTGQVVASLPTRSKDVSGYDALTFRAALDEAATGEVDLAVTVVDRRGRSSAKVAVSEVSDALTAFPGTKSPLPKTWLRTVRIPTRSLSGIDLRDVREVRLSGASATGAAYLADLAFSRVRVGDARLSELPQVSVDGLSVPEGDGPGTATMTLRLSARSRVPVKVNVQSIAAGAAPVITQVAQEVVFPPNATSATFQVPLVGNTTVAQDAQAYQVVASVPTSAVIGSGFTRLVVTDDDAP
ncbi:alpha/beta hydrolase [Actinopolymorpha alba]|uniref:alpha/beta hydrolase n=1 Tax=Actinopolymorpha alba TaxID=533267 RepID=UPI00036E035C|nr:alpha/beta hydrolase [Actinopolymorpha alba]